MNRFVHIMLALLVIACPLWCAFACCGLSEVVAEAAPSCCCDSGQQKGETDSPSNPQPQQPSQCICGGAVLVDAFELENSDVWASLFMLGDVHIEKKLVFPQEAISFDSDASLADSGRPLRQLYDSWIL